MTILKADLITKVNETFNRKYATDTTELDDLITDCCWELSSRGNFLHDEYTLKSIAETDCYSVPLHFKDELVVAIDGQGLLTFEDFETYKYHTIVSTSTGVPKKYTYERGFATGVQENLNFLYLRPAPDSADYTIRLYFACYHPRTITVDEEEKKACDYILFPDEFKMALQEIVLWKWADGKNMTKEGLKHLAYAKDQVNNLEKNVKNHWRCCPYNDFA